MVGRGSRGKSRRAACCFTVALCAILAHIAPSRATDHLRVAKPAALGFGFSMLDVGIAAGIFAKHDLDVESIVLEGSAKQQQAMAAGAIDVDLGAGTDLAFIAKGVPEKAVAALAGPPLNFVVMVRSDGTINRVEDLKGKRISASTVGSVTYWFASQLSRRQGWQGSDALTIVPLGNFDAMRAALVTGNIDAISATLEGALLLEAAGSGKLLLSFGDFITPFLTHAAYATDELMQDRPDALRRFLQGWFETVAWMNAHKEEGLRYSSAVTTLPHDIASKVYDAEMPMFFLNGRFDPKAVAGGEEIAHRDGPSREISRRQGHDHRGIPEMNGRSRARHATTSIVAALLAGLFLTAPRASCAADLLRIGNPAGDDFHFSLANVGSSAGIFKKYDLEIEITALAGGAKLHAAMIAGSLDIALGAGTDIGLIVKGATEKGVGVLATKPSNMVLQANTLSHIASIADLKGKKVAVSSVGALTYWLAQQLMRHEGWGPSGLDLVATGGGQANVAGFVSGNLDAAVTSLEAALRVEQAGQGKILLTFGDIVDPFIAHVVYATNDLIAQHPDRLRRFLKAWYETVAYAHGHKAETIRFSQPVTLLPDDLASKVYDIEMPTFSTDGRFDPVALEAVKQALIDLGQLTEKPDNSAVITEAFLPGS